MSFSIHSIKSDDLKNLGDLVLSSENGHAPLVFDQLSENLQAIICRILRHENK